MPSFEQTRSPRALGIGDRGHDIGHARTGSHRAHARPSGDARVGIVDVPRGLVVAHVDHADAFVEAPVVHGLDLTAAEREEVRGAVGFNAWATSRPPWA